MLYIVGYCEGISLALLHVDMRTCFILGNCQWVVEVCGNTLYNQYIK